jgi:guanylate kinase
MKPNGSILGISGPSGVGKQYLINQLVQRYPEKFEYVPSTTTKPDPHDGSMDYIYVSGEEYDEIRENHGFVNNVGNIYHARYGYTKVAVDKVFSDNKVGIITPYGPIAHEVIKTFEEHYELKTTTVYLKPINAEFLKQRMISRARESIEKIEEKLKDAETEIHNLAKHEENFDKIFLIQDNNIEPIITWIVENT